jgi:hypothetical protein
MKIDFKKIINIKNENNLNGFLLNKPIFQKNYLFHYLIELNNLDGLKLKKWPIYIENNDGLNGFHIAARSESNIKMLEYLIKTYPEYIYNRNLKRETFVNYLQFNQFAYFIKKFKKLDWDDLIINATPHTQELFVKIILNLNYIQLSKFLNVYKIKPTNINNYLHGVIKSSLLSSDEKIKILNKYSDEELNIKPLNTGIGLIFIALDNNDEKLIDYLLTRNIDLNYYTFIKTNTPLSYALNYDIMNNTSPDKYIFSKQIFEKLKSTDPDFLKTFNNNLDNILHSCLLFRYNRNQLMDVITKINYPELEILKYYDSYLWNQLNIDKISPLELIINLDYDIYSNIIENRIAVNPEILEKLKNENNPYHKKWLKLFEQQPKYNEPINDIIIECENCKYTHYTLFQSKFKDVGIFILYLNDKYKELLIPNMQTYIIKNLTFENTFPFSDDLIVKESVFPWIILYYSNTEYYIHPYLNNLINAERYNKNKRFGIVFLSLIYDKGLHANVLIYDFKNLTIERFEPYGNTSLIENEVDDLLEEELTWSTGLKYLRPKDFLPFAGFQTISDETNLINTKAGDFGGFCLAWCLWYIETRIKNSEIDSKTLILKLIKKLNKMEYTFSEHIRNYSNKINNQRIKYIKKIGIDEKEISNIYLTNNNDSILADFLIKKYNGSTS